MAIFANKNEFLAGLEKSKKTIENKVRIRARRLMEEGMRRLLRRTPVHTGEAVKNYVATVGNPYAGAVKAGVDPVEKTNQLELGRERLRPAAEAVSLATLAGVNYNDPFQKFWITNRDPDISGLEAGELPLPPFKQRSPQGMFRVTLQELINLLETRRA